MDFPLPPASFVNIQQHDNQLQTPGAQKHQPLAPGQVLLGVVRAKGENTTYQLDIGGKQVLAQSNLPLHVGQKLNLQITKLAPQIALQVISTPQTTRQLTGSIHLLSKQSSFLTNLTELASQANQANISQPSQQTLKTVAQQANTLFSLTGREKTEAVTNLFQHILQALQPGKPAVLPQSPALQTTLHNILGRSNGQANAAPPAVRQILQTLSPGSIIPLTAPFSPLSTSGDLAQLINSNTQAAPQVLTLAQQILRFFTAQTTVAPSSELHALISLGLQQSSDTREPTGQALHQLVDRLGLNMEQLLAQGKREEAVQTLKFALLELGQQLTGTTTSGEQANQMLQTVELYQMLQVKLASEAIFFMPLPLPFLDQGYLIIDQQPEQENQGQNEGETTTQYTLHLQLEGLGNLRIEIKQRETSADINFYGEDQQKMAFMREHKEELARWLTAIELSSAQFFTGAENPAQALLKNIANAPAGMINTQA
ncbi:MAG: hypothetical protein CSB34_04330 [Desulfobulbus propionicus]|nr:MAG: hypothetical protein CSB34_04330 [Desulfobulbus propionicus]